MGSVVGAAIAGVLLLGGVVFAAFLIARHRRLDAAIRGALGDSDPSVRIAAIELLARRGAEHHLATLLWRSRVELDVHVRLALEHVIGPDDARLLRAGAPFRERRRTAIRYLRGRAQHPF